MSRNQLATEAGVQSQELETIQAAAARTKGDVVRIGSGAAGIVDVTLADDTDVYKVAVATQTLATGVQGEYVIKGEVAITVPTGTYVAGNGVHILDGALADSGGAAEKPNAAPANNDFCVIITGGVDVTEITVAMYGDPITAQT